MAIARGHQTLGELAHEVGSCGLTPRTRLNALLNVNPHTRRGRMSASAPARA